MIPLERQIRRGEVATLEFISSPTMNLKKPLTILIQPKNLEMEALALYLLRRFLQTRVVHVFREGNRCADALARMGSNLAEEFLVFDSPPSPDILYFVNTDVAGILRDGRQVSVKRLYEHNCKRVEQFMNEVEILTRLRHTNLVSPYGCTSRTSRELLLVYEYIPNGTVADHLHGDLAKPVADFGLSRLFPTDVTHVSTAPQGTPGYVDPEYHECYQLTEKSDVFSFGVVLIELISSMPAVDISRHRHC
ncbi:hypothetical protein SO802_021177 [Lithocarpus litseifolius]|uniref:Protein kinase domain-containing protein n=1 Tax=Lithocarpus litseifolius TaxID=425828 RepID=A0AAW2CFI2_9ROSI